MNPTKSSERSVLKWVLWIRNEWIILFCAVVLFLSWELYSKSGLSKWTSLVWAVGCLRAVLTWLSCLIKSCACAGLGAQLHELLPIVWLRRALHQHPGWHPGNSFKNIACLLPNWRGCTKAFHLTVKVISTTEKVIRVFLLGWKWVQSRKGAFNHML